MLTVSYDIFRVNPKDLVLDAGCGEGRHALELSKMVDCSIVAMDIEYKNPERVKAMNELMDQEGQTVGLTYAMQGDTENLPFEDCTFDKIICSEVIEHLNDDKNGIEELARVLKEGGEMAVTVPTFFTEAVYGKLSKEYFNCPGGHVRICSPKGLADTLRENDLRVYSIRFEHAFHSVYWLLRCIFGLSNESAFIPALYRRFLVAIIHSKIMGKAERVLNFFFPKSMVLYTKKMNSKP
ncbi:MAG: class I SAM-dependent methyltransferase [Thermodesulfobacteriota bacterium]|nr:class I SAM-dependent methyltransferase [Thermodesulfobacteriota bacterium]